MKTIKYNTKTTEVITLCELLSKIGYAIQVSDFFSKEVDAAVRDFQTNNFLVVDGIVGIKTWSKLFEKNSQIFNNNDKFLSEHDLINFANTYQLELAIIKAVNEIESNGKGFLLDGKPRILFEGHIFWRELKKRGFDPQQFLNSNTQDILYESWTKKYYKGGEGEHIRLQKAISLNSSQEFKDAANSAASWGSFQIMGFNALSLGYDSIDDFVARMYLNEGEHLKAFGKFLEVNNLIPLLHSKNWSEFALRYNGQGYKANRYDEKLYNAYIKYSKS